MNARAIDAPKLRTLNAYTSMRWHEAAQKLPTIRKEALAVLGCHDENAFLHYCQNRVATVVFLAGAGSRWVESVRLSQRTDIDPEKPRCLAPIADIDNPEKQIPIGTYNLRAIQGIGQTHIVWRTHLSEISDMADNSGIINPNFSEQIVPPGFSSPMGHGDALRQIFPKFGDQIKFVVTVFGGDVTSRETILSSLMVMAAMQKLGRKQLPWGILPTTLIDNPVYFIEVDDKGLPTRFGHNKLLAGAGQVDRAQCNVGLRLYLKDAIAPIIQEYAGTFDAEKGYQIAGNQGNEFALDNIDTRLAAEHRLRGLCIARPEEITPVKNVLGLDAFLAAQRSLRLAGR